MGSGSRGICELASMPFSRMDLSKDFTTDPRFDYHGRDASCYRRTYDSTYNDQNQWRYSASKSNLPYGSSSESWRHRQSEREFSAPRFGDRIPNDFFRKPPDYDRYPAYERPRDGPRYANRPYIGTREPGDDPYRDEGRRSPDHRNYGYGRPYADRPLIRPMEYHSYPRYPSKIPYYMKYPERRHGYDYPDSGK